MQSKEDLHASNFEANSLNLDRVSGPAANPGIENSANDSQAGAFLQKLANLETQYGCAIRSGRDCLPDSDDASNLK